MRFFQQRTRIMNYFQIVKEHIPANGFVAHPNIQKAVFCYWNTGMAKVVKTPETFAAMA